MEIKYEKIVDANKGISYTDVRGKNYAEVAQRVQAFRKLIPGGFITTEILSNENGVVYMKAEAGYMDNGQKVTLATGHAFERQDASNINKTSFIENCETSAVGRALGFIGLGSEKSIASAEEVDNAIKTQEAIASGKVADPVKRDAPAKVEQAAQIPADPVPPVLQFLAKERESLRVVREIDQAQNNAIWNEQVKVLKEAGIIPNKPLSKYTKDEATDMVAAMYANFDPTGTVLKDDRETPRIDAES